MCTILKRSCDNSKSRQCKCTNILQIETFHGILGNVDESL
jgi:hypothetical protein